MKKTILTFIFLIPALFLNSSSVLACDLEGPHNQITKPWIYDSNYVEVITVDPCGVETFQGIFPKR